jgi:hypothetical protein
MTDRESAEGTVASPDYCILDSSIRTFGTEEGSIGSYAAESVSYDGFLIAPTPRCGFH